MRPVRYCARWRLERGWVFAARAPGACVSFGMTKSAESVSRVPQSASKKLRKLRPELDALCV